MRTHLLLVAGLAALIAGCSDRPAGNASTNSAANASAAAPENAAGPAPANGSASAGAPEYRRLAECASKFEAVARMYDAMADTVGGAQAIDLVARAGERRTAAISLNARAESAAIMANAPEGEVARIRRETDASIEAERARQPFEAFALWVGREADACAPLARPS